ncbi:MAG: hypothetical protein ACLSH6_04795 [Limosilactobacillus pontis]
MKAGLVDEISLVMAPYISGDTTKKEHLTLARSSLINASRLFRLSY